MSPERDNSVSRKEAVIDAGVIIGGSIIALKMMKSSDLMVYQVGVVAASICLGYALRSLVEISRRGIDINKLK